MKYIKDERVVPLYEAAKAAIDAWQGGRDMRPHLEALRDVVDQITRERPHYGFAGEVWEERRPRPGKTKRVIVVTKVMHGMVYWRDTLTKRTGGMQQTTLWKGFDYVGMHHAAAVEA